MNKESRFFKKLTKNGFYVVLFLCLSAIGISGYVIHLARGTADEIKKELNLESSLNIPFPTFEEDTYETVMEEKELVEIEKAEQQDATEEEPQKDVKTQSEKEPVVETAAIEKEEETVYTMALLGAITSPFSGEELVKSKTLGDWRIHSGVDIKGELGCDVLAIADGTVIGITTDSMMGNVVTVEHKNGMTSIYANLADEIKHKAGDAIKGGDVIGKVGNSALAECMEEPHLHLEVKKDGKNIDPLSLFPAGEE